MESYDGPDYTGQHFFFEIDQLNDELENAVDLLRMDGVNKAQAEHDYRVALAQKIWDLRSQGLPATLIHDLARGDEDVAMLKLKRDAAESEYWTDQESIQATKLKIRVVNDQIGREWGRPSNT